MFALAALADASGPEDGFDRIEHGAVVSDEMALRLADLGMPVITQPAFSMPRAISTCRSQQIKLEICIDFAGCRIWGARDCQQRCALWTSKPLASVATAVNRQTATGAVLGARECVCVEDALAGYLTPHQR